MTANNLLISIIIPIYNSVKFLKNTIESVLKQTYTNIELILVDDGSTDTSAVICKAYLAIDPRVQFYTKSNSGANATRAVGLSHAKGEYIYFMDSDDTIAPNEISTLVSELDGADILISGCNNNLVLNRNEYIKAIFNYTIPINLCGNLYKKEKLKVDFFLTGEEIIMGEDMLSNLMIAGEVKSIKGIQKSTYFISKENTNSISRTFVRSAEYESLFINKIEEILSKLEGIENREELIGIQKLRFLKYIVIEDKNLDIKDSFVLDLFQSVKNSKIHSNIFEKIILRIEPLHFRLFLFRYYLLFRRKFNL